MEIVQKDSEETYHWHCLFTAKYLETFENFA